MNRNSSIFIFFIAVVISIISYFSGRFIALFDSNQCYSHVIDAVAEDAISSYESSDSKKVIAFKDRIKRMPLRGYESNCDVIRTYIEHR
jgi:hypothetical protein